MVGKIIAYYARRWAEKSTTRPGVVLVAGALLAWLADDPATRQKVIEIALLIAGGLAASLPDRKE